MRSLIAAAALVAAAGGPAGAGVFGGFSADESKFLRGSDAVCTPIAAEAQTARTSTCRKAAPDEVARLGFRRGGAEAGPAARFTAAASGTTMTLSDATGAARVRWSSIDPISEVGAVYVSEHGKLVAVELRIRFAGHLGDDVVVFAMPDAPAAAGAGPAAGGGPAAAGAPGPRSKALEATLKAAWRQSKARMHAKAEKIFREAIGLDGSDPEAHYGLAVSLAGQKKQAEALAELDWIAASPHPDAIVWRVEARFDAVFRPMLADPGFRKATGMDAGGKTTYERAVGAGGKWEQAGSPCATPQVNLDLQRRPREFDLALVSKCQGTTDRTRLDGTWAVDAKGMLVLTFPNPGGADEVVSCSLEACGGEDCMVCGRGGDLEMNLRSVRR